MAEPRDAAQGTTAGSLIGVSVWRAGSPWRLASLWLVLAGLLASAGLRLPEQNLLSVLLALLLADPLWGALWRQLAERGPGQSPRRPHLPYATGNSPAAWLLGRPADQPGAAWPVLALALLAALALGPKAVLLSGAALALALAGRWAQGAGKPSLLQWLQVSAQAALPFALGATLVGPPFAPATLLGLAGLGGGATLWARSSLSSADAGTSALAWAAAGSAWLIVALLLIDRPLAAGVAALLAAGPLLLLARPGLAPSRSVQVWWWLLTMTAAALLGLGLG